MIAGDRNYEPLDSDSIPGSIRRLTEHSAREHKKFARRARERSRRLRCRAARMRRIAATRPSTPPTSPTQRPGICTPTTSCHGSAPARRRRGASRRFARIRSSGSRRLRLRAVGLVGGFPTSDHRSVWVDVTVPTVKSLGWRGDRPSAAPPAVFRLFSPSWSRRSTCSTSRRFRGAGTTSPRTCRTRRGRCCTRAPASPSARTTSRRSSRWS